jgi:hypothetical protein
LPAPLPRARGRVSQTPARSRQASCELVAPATPGCDVPDRRPQRGHHPHVKMAPWSERSAGRSICVISAGA